MSDKDNNKDDHFFEDDDELSSFMSELDDASDKAKGSEPKQQAEKEKPAGSVSDSQPEIVEEPEESAFSSSTGKASGSENKEDDFDFSWDDDDHDDLDSDFKFDSEEKGAEPSAATQPQETEEPSSESESEPVAAIESKEESSFESEPEEDFTASFGDASTDEPKLDFEADAEGGSDYYSNDAYQEGGESGFMVGVKSFCANNSRMLMVAGIAVATIIGLRLFFSPTSDQQTLLTAPKPNPIHVAQQAKLAPAPMPALQQSVASEERLSSMKSTLKGHKSDLNAMHMDLSRLQNRLSATDRAMQQLSTQVHQLQGTNQKLVAQVKLIEKREEDKLKKQQYKENHYVHYHVQALEEGRAWLMGSNGLLTSVSVGSRLEHYGEVLSIDVDNGAVVTGSGETIHYKLDAASSAALR